MKKYIVLALFFVISSNVFGARLQPELIEQINRQVKSELDAAYTYLALSNQAEAMSLSGVAHFFTVHFYEELNHAREMMKFLHDQDGEVVLMELPSPKTPKVAPTALLGFFTASLEHEVQQSGRIHQIVKMARAQQAYAAEVFFSGFVEEQVEEEALFTSLVDRFRIAGENPAAILELDRELGKRPMPEIFR